MVAQAKKELRKNFLNLRRNLPSDSRLSLSNTICQHLALWINSGGFKSIFFYMPTQCEPDLTNLFDQLQSSHLFSIPKISLTDGEMEFFPFDQQTILANSKFGIPEPQGEDLYPSIPDEKTIMLIPCVAMDRQGIRLGYGGGYFDRYLNAYPNTTKIGICFEQFVVDELPSEPWDIQLDWICTEKSIKKSSE